MSLTISPDHYIEFRNSTIESTSSLNLENPHDSIVHFKVRTTAPKTYTVKPASGEIPPKSNIEISIDYHPPSSHKDKFLIMSTRSKLWDDGTSHEHKLRVKFLDIEKSEPSPDSASNTLQPKTINPTTSPALTIPKSNMVPSKDAAVTTALSQNNIATQRNTNTTSKTERSEDEGSHHLYSFRVAIKN
eukprot:NODE_8_length_66115_cov_0.981823.p40 type:complete len:188 gc:universal NODE_8_length_66115_cov_0.981823:31757-31194(-)